MNTSELLVPKEVLDNFRSSAERIGAAEDRLGVHAVEHSIGLTEELRPLIGDKRVTQPGHRQQIIDDINGARLLKVALVPGDAERPDVEAVLFGERGSTGTWLAVRLLHTETGNYEGVDTTVHAPGLDSCINRYWGRRLRLGDAIGLNSSTAIGKERRLYLPLRVVKAFGRLIASIE